MSFSSLVCSVNNEQFQLSFGELIQINYSYKCDHCRGPGFRLCSQKACFGWKRKGRVGEGGSIQTGGMKDRTTWSWVVAPEHPSLEIMDSALLKLEGRAPLETPSIYVSHGRRGGGWLKWQESQQIPVLPTVATRSPFIYSLALIENIWNSCYLQLFYVCLFFDSLLIKPVIPLWNTNVLCCAWLSSAFTKMKTGPQRRICEVIFKVRAKVVALGFYVCLPGKPKFLTNFLEPSE